jgi:hypothetical protein
MKHAATDIYPLGGLRLLLRDECEKVGGIRAWGRARRISASHVSRVIRGEMRPGPKLLTALGLKESTVYVPTTRGTRRQSDTTAGSPHE